MKRPTLKTSTRGDNSEKYMTYAEAADQYMDHLESHIRLGDIVIKNKNTEIKEAEDSVVKLTQMVTNKQAEIDALRQLIESFGHKELKQALKVFTDGANNPK